MDQVELYKQILGRARARPDKLPVFQDITTVSHIETNIVRLKQSNKSGKKRLSCKSRQGGANR